MTLFQQIRKLFAKPPAEAIAADMIQEYARLFLAHQGQSEYHKKMAQYYSESIERLARFKPHPTSAVGSGN